MFYRCYLLGEDGKIRSSEVIECRSDAAALEEARCRLADRAYPTIEVWDRARRVGVISNAKNPVQSTAYDRDYVQSASQPKAGMWPSPRRAG